MDRGEISSDTGCVQELRRNQVEFDILPQDTLCQELDVKGTKAVVNGIYYSAVIVPYSQYLPEKIIKRLSGIAQNGIPVCLQRITRSIV